MASTSIPSELSALPRLRRPAVMNFAEFWLRLPKLTERLGALGDRFVLPMPGMGAWLCVTHPDDVQAVFRAPAESAYFAEGLRMLSPHELVLGDQQLTALDGDVHLAKRRMLLPAFNADAMDRYEPTIEAKAREIVGQWPVDEPTRASHHMQRVTLEIIMAAIFGVTDPQRLARLRSAVLALTQELGSVRFGVQIAISNVRNDGLTGHFRGSSSSSATSTTSSLRRSTGAEAAATRATVTCSPACSASATSTALGSATRTSSTRCACC